MVITGMFGGTAFDIFWPINSASKAPLIVCWVPSFLQVRSALRWDWQTFHVKERRHADEWVIFWLKVYPDLSSCCSPPVRWGLLIMYALRLLLLLRRLLRLPSRRHPRRLQHGAPDRSVQHRTWPWKSKLQCAAPDLTGEPTSGPCSAGPHPGSSRADRAAPDLSCQKTCQKICQKKCQKIRQEICQKRMSEEMSDNMSEKNVRKNVRRNVR